MRFFFEESEACSQAIAMTAAALTIYRHVLNGRLELDDSKFSDFAVSSWSMMPPCRRAQ